MTRLSARSNAAGTIPISEAEFLRQVTELATIRGWAWYHPRPARTLDGWRTAGSGPLANGWPDLVLVRGGRLIFAELKRDAGKTTFEQDMILTVLEQVAETYIWRPRDWDFIERESPMTEQMNELIEAARDVVLQEGRYPPTKNTRELAETFKSLVVVPKAALRRLEAALAALPPSAPPRRDMRPIHVITEEHRALERLPALLDAIETMDQKITPYGDDRPDGDAHTYIVKAETWHRVLAAARSRETFAALRWTQGRWPR